MPCPDRPAPRLQPLLCALLGALLCVPSAGCGGGAGEDGSGGLNGNGNGGGNEGRGEGGGEGGGEGEEEEPPPDLGDYEGFGVWPGEQPRPSPGGRLAGFAGYRNSPRLAAMARAGSAAGGLYRRMLHVHDPDAAQNLGEDFFHALGEGQRLWLTAIGTPSDLSPHPEETENEYGTGVPGYARYAPTDPIAWADRVLDFIADLEAGHGLVPDYVEIWNEVERPEWFHGPLADYLGLYEVAAARIRQQRPELRVGGPGLAGAPSTMDGGESVLLALIRHADATGAPLDFVSWHNYAPGGEILYSDMPNAARGLADALGLPPIEAVVSEWNIYPSAEGAVGPEFDGAHAAANFANFFVTAYERQLDGNLFFMDVDEDNDSGIIDLAGVSVGALTLHGIKKPVFRVLELLHGMTREDLLPVHLPETDEFSLRVFASRDGNRTRIVISNDIVTGSWVFAKRAREHGMDPGWLYPIWLDAGGTQADEQDLIDAGLTPEQAAATMSFVPEALDANYYESHARPAVVTVLGDEAFTVAQVLRFDATHNAPATQRDGLLPEIEQANADAEWAAAVATADYLTGVGYPHSAAEIEPIPDSLFLDWCAAEGVPYGYAVNAHKLRRDTRRDERLALEGILNAQPETLLQVESAAEAGLAVDGRKLRVDLERDSVLVVDLVH